jgi:hypothetical protein
MGEEKHSGTERKGLGQSQLTHLTAKIPRLQKPNAKESGVRMMELGLSSAASVRGPFVDSDKHTNPSLTAARLFS